MFGLYVRTEFCFFFFGPDWPPGCTNLSLLYTATSYRSLAGQRLPLTSRGFQEIFKRFSRGFQEVLKRFSRGFQEVFNRFSIGFQRTFSWTSDWAQVAWMNCMQGKTPLNTNQSIMGPVYGFFVSPALIFSPNIFASSCQNYPVTNVEWQSKVDTSRSSHVLHLGYKHDALLDLTPYPWRLHCGCLAQIPESGWERT